MTEKIIMLIEDNPDDETLTLLAFRKNNILNEVVVARDGEEALDMLIGDGPRSFSQRGQWPSVILLDLNLPKFNGHEVLERIRQEPRTRMLPVVILTSSREEQDLVASYCRGCNSYIRKPVEFRQFVEATRQLGMYWLLLNDLPSNEH